MGSLNNHWWVISLIMTSPVYAYEQGGTSLLSLFLKNERHLLDSDKGIGEICRNRTVIYEQALMNTDLWALMMLDASTKIPEGLLVFTLTHLGNFDECIQVQDVSKDGEPVHGQYCLISVTLGEAGSQNGVLVAADTRMLRNVTSFVVKTITMAVCLPAGCSAQETALYMQGVLAPVLGNNTAVSANPFQCQTAEEPPFRDVDWVAVGFLTFFGVLVVLSTAYDLLKRNEESRKNLLVAFSVYTNGKRLLATSSSGDTLHAVHGIRFVSICWVVMGHRYAKEVSMPVMNKLYAKDFIEDWKRLGVTNATLSVDTFFVLSGLLVSYVFFKQVPKTKSFNVFLYYIHRYIRLTPALAAVVLLQTTLVFYAGSGPLWKSGYIPFRESCEQNWWVTLLYVNNYVKSAHMCVGQTWYLAADMQLHWLSPLVLVPLWKWPLIGKILLGALSLGGLITSFTIAYVNEYPVNMLHLIGDVLTDYMKHFYYPTHTRFVPYLIGIALGYILVKVKQQDIDVKFSKLTVLALWGAAATCMLLSLCIVHPFYQPEYEFNLWEASFYNCLDRPIWSLGVALVIFLCSTGHGGFANTLLSWEAFQPLSRLSYCIYLVHELVMTAKSNTVRSLTFLEDINTIPKFAADVVISIFFAACLSLVFESPFIIIEKSLLEGRSKRSPQTDAAPVEQQEDLASENEHSQEESPTTSDTRELI